MGRGGEGAVGVGGEGERLGEGLGRGGESVMDEL